MNGVLKGITLHCKQKFDLYWEANDHGTIFIHAINIRKKSQSLINFLIKRNSFPSSDHPI